MFEDIEIPRNTLALRYASEGIISLWGEENIVRQERKLWCEAMHAQQHLGVSIEDEAIMAYEREIDTIDLESIAEREDLTNHDVVARKDEFNHLAGYTYAHQGFTSRDNTDNCEQLRIYASLIHTRNRCYPVLARFEKRARKWSKLKTCGRSHLQPGQVTTYGKRMATLAEEFLVAFHHLVSIIENYQFRGFKGAMGTTQDLVTMLGSTKKAREFEARMCKALSMGNTFDSTGQVYPRSQDFMVAAALGQLVSAPANLANMIRLMASHRELNEGFAAGRKGSSAMPHKKNPSKSERICGLLDVVNGYVSMASRLLGKQWLEGDVSCSVTRRIIFPDIFFAVDAIFETTITVLDQMTANQKIIEKNLREELPFLSTTLIRDAARKAGGDDAVIYNCIQRHALAASEAIQQARPNDLLERLAGDDQMPLSLAELEALLESPNVGDAEDQVQRVCRKILKVLHEVPEEIVRYTPQTRT